MQKPSPTQDLSVADAELGGDFDAVRRARLVRDARLTPAERLLRLDGLLRGAAVIRASRR